MTRHGWRTSTASDGTEVIRRFEEEVPALVLLDLNLPGMDGWQVTEWIRSVGTTPVLMVTALGAEADVIRGLVAGADDYLTKPISFPELIARITAALRRSRLSGARDEDAPLEFDGLRIEPVTHRVVGDAAEVHLTPTEFRLLLTLARRQDGLVGHADLLRSVWGPTYGEETQLLRVTMRNLRAKPATATPGARSSRPSTAWATASCGSAEAPLLRSAPVPSTHRSKPTSPARVPAKAAGHRSSRRD